MQWHQALPLSSSITIRRLASASTHDTLYFPLLLCFIDRWLPDSFSIATALQAYCTLLSASLQHFCHEHEALSDIKKFRFHALHYFSRPWHRDSPMQRSTIYHLPNEVYSADVEFYIAALLAAWHFIITAEIAAFMGSAAWDALTYAAAARFIW